MSVSGVSSNFRRYASTRASDSQSVGVAPRCSSAEIGSSSRAAARPRNARSDDPARRILQVLLDEPRRRAEGDLVLLTRDGFENRQIDLEVEPCRERDGAHHPDGIFREALVRIADAAHQPRPQVLQPADIVDDGERRDVVEQRVDREVAPEGVLFGRAERVVVVDRPVGLCRCAVRRRLRAFLDVTRPGQPPERRHLDRLRPELDVREPEASADDPAVPEQPLHLIGMSRRADVEVLRPPIQQQIPHAAANQVHHVFVLPQPVQDLQCVRIDLSAGERMLGAGDDRRLGHRRKL